MLKKNNGFVIIKIAVAIIIIALVAFICIHVSKKLLKTVDELDIETKMLQIQAKSKIVMDKNKANGSKLIGIQISSEEVKFYNITDELKSELPENTEKCYIWTKEILEEQGLNEINIDNNIFYIIEYESNEIYYSRGIEINGEKIYKLSSISQ